MKFSDPFKTLSLNYSFYIDRDVLDKAHANSLISSGDSERINHAYMTLKDPIKRISALKELFFPGFLESDGQFTESGSLERLLEIQEKLEDKFVDDLTLEDVQSEVEHLLANSQEELDSSIAENNKTAFLKAEADFSYCYRILNRIRSIKNSNGNLV